MPTAFTDLLTVLESNAERFETLDIFRFLARGDEQTDALAYGELLEHCRDLAGNLQAVTRELDRVLIVFHPGRDLIISVLGTMIAGRVPVIVPPNIDRNRLRFNAILANAEPTAILCGDTLHESLLASEDLPRMPRLYPFHGISRRDSSWLRPGDLSGKPALLQYTSGSTSTPRGVVLTHANLVHNLTQIQCKMATTPDDVAVIWLPPYHDMGLIGGILQPLFVGIPTYLMPPVYFVQKPVRWLRAIHNYRATVTGGPNFALKLCVDRIAECERQSLSLESLRLLFIGAERIRPATLSEFSRCFHRAGFAERAFYPCYGLAESTLMSTGGIAGAGIKTHTHPVLGTTHVSCGTSIDGQHLQIVDAISGESCIDDQVGEVLISSPSVTAGYLGNAIESDSLFVQRPDPTGVPLRFLRTGDLGYRHDGDVYITARRKDIVIIRGRTLYPDDLEEAVENADTRLKPNGIACFSLDDESSETLIVLCEVQRKDAAEFHRNEIASRVTLALSRSYGISPAYIGFLPESGLPRTTSGKIMRSRVKQLYLERLLVEIPEPS